MNTVEYTLDLLDSLAQQTEAPAMIHDIVDNGDDMEVWATFPANPEYDVITFVSVEVVGPHLDVVTISTLEPAPGEYAAFLGSVAKGVFTAMTTDPHRQHLERHRAALVAIAEGEVTTDVIAFFALGSEVWYRTKVHAKDSDGHWHMVPMSAPLDECTEHEIHPALAKADAMVRIDAQKAWVELMQVGQQMEVANPAPVNRHWRWRKDTVISMLECEGAVQDHEDWLRRAGFGSPEEAITWLKEQPQVYVDSMRRLPEFRSHVCEDSTCECCLPLLTPVQVAERNLRGGNIFNEPPEEWERQCQEWRAIIAKENTKTDDSEFTQADERAMEAAMHDTLIGEEDAKK